MYFKNCISVTFNPPPFVFILADHSVSHVNIINVALLWLLVINTNEALT